MSATCFTCPTCGPYYGNNGCCPTCQPANVITRGPCTDPGVLVNPPYLGVYDYKFCRGRLETNPGFLVSRINGSGNASIEFTEIPQVELSEIQAAENTAFGQLIVMGSDFRWRALEPPASAGLFLQSNGSGDVIFGAGPAAVVPDPLVVNDLNVAVSATVEDLVTNGTVTHNNLASGTVASILGLNASNQLVTQSLATSLAFSMFYESPQSPSPSTPNLLITPGSNLIIGNRLYDSGSNIASVATSQTVQINTSGKYLVLWCASVRLPGSGRAMVSLVINGLVVNNGNGSVDPVVSAVGDACIGPFFGANAQDLEAGQVLSLRLDGSGALRTFGARMILVKLADL